MEVTAAEFQLQANDVLNCVRRGRRVTIVEQGMPIAEIVPLSEKPVRYRNPGFGMWADCQEATV